MKKILFAAPLLAFALASCDPSEIDGGSEWSQISPEQLSVSATPVQVDGKNSNQIHVVCSSPTNVAWEADQLIEDATHTVSSDAMIYFTQIGTHKVRCYTTNTGGEPDLTELEVRVDTVSYLTSAISERLCIGTEGAPDHFGTTFDKNLIVWEQSECSDGAKGNAITIKSNLNPVLCTFRWGTGKLDTNVGKLINFSLGEADLELDIIKADGSTQTIKLATDLDAEEYSDFPEEIKKLTGYDPVDAPNATKTWVLEAGNNWGNGGSTDKQGTWWTTDVTGQGGSYGSMTFDFANGTISKVIDDPTNERGDRSSSGTFTLDFGATNESTNVLCVLKTSGGGNIVFPYLINENYAETNTFEIVTLTEEEMWLRAQHTTPSSEGTFWHFVVKEDE